ncbi:thioredoxin family protein [Carboxylicivirga sediminis]|uniref:Thioredoxin family protein n=1 Tax=Carboxylicivirga sediminis TaxID=2006564 RepID=A0A941F1N7_9BACT|nr:thioredoxin family protein [Carboxylicivirga sediminis]MBR8535173.1 thioredoxin family protein [Carboxylicivirga sediminis]
MRKMSTLLLMFALSLVAMAQVQVGDVAPKFKLLNTDYTEVALEDYNEQEGVILIFTCNHCPYAKFYEERIKQLHSAYKSQGFPVVAINPNDSVKYKEDGFSYMVDKGYEFPYLLDNEGIYKAYGANKTPHVFLLLKSGADNFKVGYIGAIDDSPQDASEVQLKYLENAIKAVKKGTAINPTLTKAIGCSIKPF